MVLFMSESDKYYHLIFNLLIIIDIFVALDVFIFKCSSKYLWYLTKLYNLDIKYIWKSDRPGLEK